MNSILLVEDDLSLIDGLEFSLRKNGFDIDITRTVNEAFSMVQDKNHDLLILDLPELNVEENITLPLLLDYKKPDQQYIDEIIDILGLADRKHHLPTGF